MHYMHYKPSTFPQDPFIYFIKAEEKTKKQNQSYGTREKACWVQDYNRAARFVNQMCRALRLIQ